MHTTLSSSKSSSRRKRSSRSFRWVHPKLGLWLDDGTWEGFAIDALSRICSKSDMTPSLLPSNIPASS